MGTLDPQPEQAKAVPQVSRLEKIDGNTGPNIKTELDAVLDDGWNLIDVFTKGTNTFAVFTRPKRQV
jgi:hypothetical protein